MAAGGVIALSLKGPDGDIVKQVNVTTTAGQTVGNVISALNTALGGAVTFTLNSDGSISTATSALYSDYQLNVTGDTTQRGSTGISFTQLFGIGDNNLANQAAGFSVNPAIANAPQRIGFATSQHHAATVAGDTIVVGGDNSGAIALQNVITADPQSFSAAGGIWRSPNRHWPTMPRPSTSMSATLSNAVTTTRPPRTTGCRKPSRAWPPIPASIWTRN